MQTATLRMKNNFLASIHLLERHALIDFRHVVFSALVHGPPPCRRMRDYRLFRRINSHLIAAIIQLRAVSILQLLICRITEAFSANTLASYRRTLRR